MAARTLEDRRDSELELVRITTQLFDQGKEQPTVERLEYLGRILGSATELQRKIDKRDARRTPPLENLGKPLSELPAPVREKVARLIDALGDTVRWIDTSPNPNGAGPWKRPLTYVRIAHGENKLFAYWLRDDTGDVIAERVID